MSAKKPEAEAPEGGEAPKKKMSGKKLVLFVVLPLLLLGGGGGAAFMMGLFGGKAGETAEAKPAAPKPIIFVDLPEMLVNLNSSGRQQNYLKLKVALEVDDPAVPPKLNDVMPRVLDSFTVFLRELRVDDLSGSAGLYRVKEELLVRVAQAVQPLPVKDVLFKEMLVQ